LLRPRSFRRWGLWSRISILSWSCSFLGGCRHCLLSSDFALLRLNPPIRYKPSKAIAMDSPNPNTKSERIVIQVLQSRLSGAIMTRTEAIGAFKGQPISLRPLPS
jgi:hypothetical protein